MIVGPFIYIAGRWWYWLDDAWRLLREVPAP